MKKIFYLVWLMVGLAVMPACQRANQLEQETMRQDSINAALQDSINTANAEKDSLMQLMSDIADGMAQIKEIEDIVSVNNLSGETPDRKKQLRDDIVLIQESVAKHKKRLDELERRLKQSTNYNDKMAKSIALMKQQLEEQEKTINSLTDQLAAAHIQIKNLNQSVDSLNTVNKAVVQAHKIVESGFLRKTKILQGDYEMSYFTKADRRTLNEIPLHSAKAQVMTNHPKSSYELVDQGGTKVLRILSPERFWEKSNFLVIKVD